MAVTQENSKGFNVELGINLVQHVGMQNELVNNKVVEVEVEIDQFIIEVHGDLVRRVSGSQTMRIGYVGRQPGTPINYLPNANRFTPKTLESITAAIQAELASRSPGSEERPVGLPMPPEIADAPIPPELAEDADSAASDENL